MRDLFSWLEQAEVIFKNPSKILRASAPVTSPEERYIPADVATLIGATPMNHQQCVALLLYSGLRLGEAHRLRAIREQHHVLLAVGDGNADQEIAIIKVDCDDALGHRP